MKRSREERKMASKEIARMAKESRLAKRQVRRVILETMHREANAQDPKLYCLWEGFTFEGEEPTAEEAVLWMNKKRAGRKLAVSLAWRSA